MCFVLATIDFPRRRSQFCLHNNESQAISEGTPWHKDRKAQTVDEVPGEINIGMKMQRLSNMNRPIYITFSHSLAYLNPNRKTLSVPTEYKHLIRQH